MNHLNKLICLFVLASILTLTAAEKGSNWPTWRGPKFTGESPSGKPATVWSETQNVRWKIAIPGKGLSSPIVWEYQIFVTTAVGIDKPVDPEKLKEKQGETPAWMQGQAQKVEQVQQFVVYAVSRKTGDILWKKMLHEALPHEGTHKDGSWASHSCVTDGKHIIVFFGSYGLYCLDMKGKLIWENDLGDLQTSNQFGAGSSPALYKNHLVINWDHEGDSFITVLDKKTGKTAWKQARDENTSWATPLVVEVNGKPQIIINATTASRGYDLKTGEVIWELGGMTRNTIPSPLVLDGTAILMSGFRGNKLQAVNLKEAKGNLENSGALIWSSDDKITPYVPSALLYEENLYILFGNNGQLSCVNAKTGMVHYSKVKIEGLNGVYAAPVAADGRIYITGRQGAVAVIKPGPVFELLQVNSLDDKFDASPAIVGRDMILRGLSSLYCISED